MDRESVAVGVASRLIPHKGHSLLLEAHARASRERPELRLLIAGEGHLRRVLAATETWPVKLEELTIGFS